MIHKAAAHDPKLLGSGVGFERIRRITGYLVGTLGRFNNAKRHEEHDRVKHSFSCCDCYERREINTKRPD